MSLLVSFAVPGLPRTKGSAKAFVVGGRARICNDNPKAKNWQAVITTLAMQAYKVGTPPVDGPVMVTATCVFARPKGHYGTGKNAATVKATAPARHTQKPDIDKVARPILDALTGVVYRDDSQVCIVRIAKRWGGCDATLIEVSRLANTPDQPIGEPVLVDAVAAYGENTKEGGK